MKMNVLCLSNIEDEIIKDQRQGLPVLSCLSNRASSFALYAMATPSLSHQGCFASID
jgi:hypothetical protein